MPQYFIKLTLLFISFVNGASVVHKGYQHTVNTKPKTAKNDSLKIELRSNIDFFGNHLLTGHKAVIQNYMRKYQRYDCRILTYKNSELKERFEGIKKIKGIRNNENNDYVFVIPPFNICDDGDSYYFLDQTLPRLYSDSYCCHPKNLFVLDDIDEDGVNEIGIYWSSCTSRFKRIIVYSLKNKQWKEIASAGFDTFMKDPDKTTFETLVKKVSKRKFSICTLYEGKTTWKTVTMK